MRSRELCHNAKVGNGQGEPSAGLQGVEALSFGFSTEGGESRDDLIRFLPFAFFCRQSLIWESNRTVYWDFFCISRVAFAIVTSSHRSFR